MFAFPKGGGELGDSTTSRCEGGRRAEESFPRWLTLGAFSTVKKEILMI